VISPPFLHLYYFPLSFSGPVLLPNLCTKITLFVSCDTRTDPVASCSIVRQRISDEFGHSGSNYSLLQVTNLQFCQLLDWSPIRSVLYVHNSKRMLLEVCIYCFRNSCDGIIPPYGEYWPFLHFKRLLRGSTFGLIRWMVPNLLECNQIWLSAECRDRDCIIDSGEHYNYAQIVSTLL